MTVQPFTLLLARHPVRIEIDDGKLASEVRALCEGFVVEHSDPWLTLHLTASNDAHRSPSRAVALPDGSGGWVIEGPRSRGTLHRDRAWHASARVADMMSVRQLLYLCLALLLPDSGTLLLHADAVALDGVAYAFLGPSGSGKSTLAHWLVERAGARPLSVDRTAVSAGSGVPVVVTVPRLLPDTASDSGPEEIPLAALVFPGAGPGVASRRLGALEANQRLLRSVIMPQGGGRSVTRAFELAQRVLDRAVATELLWELGTDVAGEVRRRSGA
jgi:hypothetical protein